MWNRIKIILSEHLTQAQILHTIQIVNKVCLNNSRGNNTITQSISHLQMGLLSALNKLIECINTKQHTQLHRNKETCQTKHSELKPSIAWI